MASDVTLSKGVRQNLLSLQSTAELLNRTQERLSTGKKVNSALDNPINFFTSSGLSSRANDLSRLLDSVGNAVQTLAAADKGIGAITKLIETAGATARQALTAAEGVTTYSVNQTGNVTLDPDVAATGNSGGTTIAADVVGVTGTELFTNATFVAEAEANIVIDVSDIANDFQDGENLTISINGTDYIFQRDDAAAGVDGVPADTYYFDGDAGVSTEDQLAQKLTAILTTADDVATVAYDNIADTITITAANNGAGLNFTTNLGTTGFAGPDVVNTAYQAASTISIDDGTTTEQFTYVSAGANAAAGTFTTLADLVSAVNDAASTVSANLTASDDGGALRLIGDNTTAEVTVTSSGTIAADLGFGVPAYTAANSGYNAALEALAGQTFDLTVGSTTTNIVFGTGGGQIATRAALDTALGAVGSINVGNQLVLTAQNNTDSISVAGTAAAALGFGGANDEFDPTNAQIAGFTGQLTIQVGSGGAQTIEFGNGATGEILNRGDLDARLAAVTASLEDVTISVAGNVLSVVSTSSENVTIGGSAAASFGIGATTYTPTSTFTANATRSSLQADFNALLTQITELAGDASFNGINLLDGDNLTVTFNEDGSSTLAIAGVTFSATGLGLTSVNGAGFQENTNVNAAIAQLDSATATLRSQASKFGSNLSIVQTRQDFTKNMISVLQIGADNLVLADTNEEGANMLALNTRQQLSTTALSLAAQADQNVLRLF